MELVNKLLNRVPILLITTLYCGWLGYEYYDWINSANSELGQKKTALKTSQQNLDKAKKKLETAEEFYKNLDVLRSRIRQLTTQLESTKAVLNAEIDIANFVRMISLEAKKLGLVIKGIRPESEQRKEFYIEVPFTVALKGAYVQVLVFFDRISKLQQIIHVSDFSMRPTGNTQTKYVELDGSTRVVAYKYLGTQADEVAKKESLNNNPAERTEEHQ